MSIIDAINYKNEKAGIMMADKMSLENLNMTNLTNESLLMLACYNDLPGLAMKLIDRGVDLTVQNDQGENALMYACYNKLIEVALKIIEKIPSKEILDVQDCNGRNVLIYCCCEDDNTFFPIVDRLLSLKVNLNMRDGYGYTALMYACKSKMSVIARKLIINGADVNIINSNQSNALIYAAKNGLEELGIQMVSEIENIILDQQDVQGYSALLYACSNKLPDLAEALLVAGADADLQEYKGNAALHYSIYYGMDSVVEKLIEVGADLDKQNRFGETPVMLMCDGVDGTLMTETLLMKMLNFNINLNITNNSNETILARACDNGLLNAIERIIDLYISRNDFSFLDQENKDHYTVRQFISDHKLQNIANKINMHADRLIEQESDEEESIYDELIGSVETIDPVKNEIVPNQNETKNNEIIAKQSEPVNNEIAVKQTEPSNNEPIAKQNEPIKTNGQVKSVEDLRSGEIKPLIEFIKKFRHLNISLNT